MKRFLLLIIIFLSPAVFGQKILSGDSSSKMKEFKPMIYSSKNPLFLNSAPKNKFLSALMNDDILQEADIALLLPVDSLQKDSLNACLQIASLLADSLGFDFNFLPSQILIDSCEVKGGSINMEKNTYRVLIIPDRLALSLQELAKIRVFWKDGGHIIFTSRLPETSINPQDNEIWQQDMSMMMMNKQNLLGGTIDVIDEPNPVNLRDALLAYPYVYDVETPEKCGLNYTHKIVEGKHIYYFANMSNKSFKGLVRLRGFHVLIAIEPTTGKKSKVIVSQKMFSGKKTTTISLSLKPKASVLLVN